MAKRKNRTGQIMAVLLTAALMMGCQNQQMKNTNTPAASQTAAKAESVETERDFLSSYQNIALTLPKGWSVTEDKKILCSFSSKNGDRLQISYLEGTAKVVLMNFPEKEEDAEELAEQNRLAGKGNISDFFVQTAEEGKTEEASFYRFCVRNTLQAPIAFFYGVKTDEEAYQVVWEGNAGSKDAQQDLETMLQSLQFPDDEILTEAFQTAQKEQNNDLEGEKKQKAKKTVTCISPVNVRTEPNVSTSKVIGALQTGEEVEMLGKENGWYKISYEGKTAYVYEDYVKENES